MGYLLEDLRAFGSIKTDQWMTAGQDAYECSKNGCDNELDRDRAAALRLAAVCSNMTGRSKEIDIAQSKAVPVLVCSSHVDQ